MGALVMKKEREFTLVETADHLGVSTQTVRRRIDAGLLRARKEGLEWRIRESDLQKYIASTFYPGRKEES